MFAKHSQYIFEHRELRHWQPLTTWLLPSPLGASSGVVVSWTIGGRGCAIPGGDWAACMRSGGTRAVHNHRRLEFIRRTLYSDLILRTLYLDKAIDLWRHPAVLLYFILLYFLPLEIFCSSAHLASHSAAERPGRCVATSGQASSWRSARMGTNSIKRASPQSRPPLHARAASSPKQRERALSISDGKGRPFVPRRTPSEMRPLKESWMAGRTPSAGVDAAGKED